MTCRNDSCGASSFSGGLCFDHADPGVRERELAQILLRDVADRVLDFRGVQFSTTAVRTLLDALGTTREVAELDLTDAIVPDDFELSNLVVTRQLGAHSTTFRGRVHFSNVQFQAASFFRASFHQLVRLGDVHFHGDASFRESNFVSGLFVGVMEGPVRFDHGLDFVGARFGGTCLFRNLSGAGDLFLQSVQLPEVDLSGVCVAGGLSFRNSTITGDLWLARARVSGALDLENCRVGGEIALDGAIVGQLNARSGSFASSPEFGNMLVRDWAVLDHCTFGKPVRVRICASKLHCARTNFLAGASLEVYADVVLDGARLGGTSASPSSLSPNRPPSNELTAPIEGETIAAQDVTITSPPRLVSARGADLTGLSLESVDLTICLFGGASGLDTVRFGSGAEFRATPGGPWTTRDTVFEEHLWRTAPGLTSDDQQPNRVRLPGTWSGPDQLPEWFGRTVVPPGMRRAVETEPLGFMQANDVATIYRQLRKAREDAKDEPGAADFYYGEMEMRRRFLREATNPRKRAGSSRAESVLLTTYWLVAGYGLRAWRPLVVLACVVALAAFGLDHIGFAAHHRGWWHSFVAALNSCTSLLHPQLDAHLGHAGQAIEVTLRVAGPSLLGLIFFALRARVRR